MRQSYKRYRFLARRRVRKIDKYFHLHPIRMFAAGILAVVLLSALFFIPLSGKATKISDANIVILYVDHETSTLPTREETVGEFLEKAEVKINDGDVVEPSLDTRIEEDNFHVNVYRAAPVVVYDGDKKMFGLSAALTPRSLAEQTGARLYPEDIVITEPSNDFLKDGSIGNKVVISRATPANLNLYGTPLSVRTHAKTVGDLLKEKKVKLANCHNVLLHSLRTSAAASPHWYANPRQRSPFCCQVLIGIGHSQLLDHSRHQGIFQHSMPGSRWCLDNGLGTTRRFRG